MRTGKLLLAMGALGAFAGCQYVGPIAIDQGRDRYNHIIQSTSKEQTFSNIIRVKHHEPTSFMDVTEVDATTSFTGSVSGTVSNIGARAGTSGGTLAGQTGGIASGVTYSESPLIRYQPLLGQALVAQLATPVGPEAIAALYDSNWGTAPLLDMAAAFLTLDYEESSAALNTIAALDVDNAVELVAEKSDVTKAKDQTKSGTIGSGNVTLQVTNKSGGGGSSDALVIYYMPRRDAARARKDDLLWRRLLWLYQGSQATVEPDKDAKCDPSPCKPAIDRSRIELRTMPVSSAQTMSKKLLSGAPVMKTFSAVGILKNAAETPNPRIEFVSHERYIAIRSHFWNDLQNNSDLAFYTLLPADEVDEDESTNDRGDQRLVQSVCKWLQSNGSPFLYNPQGVADFDFIEGNRRLVNLRRYVLVITSEVPPVGAYVSHFDRGIWYYIDGADEISQKNFDLISLLMTVMAVPSATPPLSPSISVGGGG